MRWKKLAAILQEHPYLLDDRFRMPMREAMARQAAEGYLPFPAMVARAKERSTLPPEAWRAVDAVLERGTPAVPHLGRTARRLLLAAALALAMALFMACTPVGRAMAADIYRVFVEVRDGALRAYGKVSPDEVEPVDFTNLPSEFESIEQLAEVVVHPIAVPGNDADLISMATYVSSSNGMVVRCKYAQKNGNSFTLKQSLYGPSVSWGSVASTVGEIRTLELDIGITAYVSTMDDGTVYGEAAGADYRIHVSSSSMSLDDMEALMMELVFLE